MNMTAALDVAIGLVLMYLILSLFCTTINEFIANFLKLRASTLQSALEQMIDDPNLRALFYNNGLIDGSRVAASAGAVARTDGPAPGAPPPTPPPAVGGGLWAKIVGVATTWRAKHPSYLSGSSVAMALIGSLDSTNAIPAISNVETAVKALPDSNIRDAMAAALAQANGDVNKLRDTVAAWYDDSMDRLSGAYKRYLKTISILVGLAIAAGVNADTLQVARTLWTNPVLRNEEVDLAAKVTQDKSAIQSSTNCTPPTGGDANDAAHQAYDLCALNAEVMALPIGWTAPLPYGFSSWVWKILGIWLTAIALSLGAPFWFDLLTQFVNLRGAGVKPAPAKPS
jgi:hypothetical protein